MKITEVVGVRMHDSKRPLISVIIRTKNKEKWIGRCLQSVFDQKVDAEVEVILVDNYSTDNTINIANRYPVSKFINIKKYFPGKALNYGISKSKGDYIVCLSAHCEPENDLWLSKLLNNLNGEHKFAGVYGRQLPLSFTNSTDKRDMLITFGLDRRIQEKDYFFHNANSMILRSVWEKFPFDENVSNIEDRVWGKQVIEAGYKIIYDPEAAIYHYQGLHKGNTNDRIDGVISILEHVDEKTLKRIPSSMTPEKLNVAAVIPIMSDISKNKKLYNYYLKVVADLKKSHFVKSIYCIAENQYLAESVNIKLIDRKYIKKVDSLGLNKLLMYSLELIEACGDFPESILYVNHDYINRPSGIFDKLIKDSQYKDCDTIFPGLIDYGHYWYHNEQDEYKQTDPSLKPRVKRDPLYKALYGLGCLTASWLIREGKMIGGKVGIFQISDSKYSKRLTN